MSFQTSQDINSPTFYPLQSLTRYFEFVERLSVCKLKADATEFHAAIYVSDASEATRFSHTFLLFTLGPVFDQSFAVRML